MYEDIQNILADNSEDDDFTKFKSDFEKLRSNGIMPSPHEIVSCIIILRCFKNLLDKLADKRKQNIRYLFMIRCILGILYNDDRHSGYKNGIIKLLNSSIDVDKLDYISRDSKVSGYDNTMIDTNRLLSSLSFALYEDSNNKYNLCVAFRKTALGVIQNVVLSRNALYTWIYSHHKVKYEGYLIKKAIEVIANNSDNYKMFISKYFSVKSIQENLISDDAIWNLFMNNLSVPQVNELIERKSQKVAIWKSFAEFEAYFNNTDVSLPVGDFSSEKMRKYLNNKENISKFEKYINQFDENIEFTVVINKTKLSKIEHNSTLIYINNGLYSFDTIFKDLYKESNIPIFFYVYCSRDSKEKINKDKEIKAKLIAHIKSFEGFKFEPQ